VWSFQYLTHCKKTAFSFEVKQVKINITIERKYELQSPIKVISVFGLHKEQRKIPKYLQ
jgi:hypothetical protein